MAYRAEYIWIDGTEPTPLMRSKTKIVPDGDEPGLWNFDGSSTNQAEGSNSDCMLNPVYTVPDPTRGGNDVLVLCEVLLPESLEPHSTNNRAACVEIADKFADFEPLFGLEQEYTFFKDGRPLGWPQEGYYYPAPQGPYYCGVGAVEIAGRDIVEAHTSACMAAGLSISGTNAEVMLGQWEFQIGPCGTVEVADQIWMARYLLYRISEDFGVNASISAKPIKGDWNGAGCHTNFST
ncbi:MAG TPA: glutamine synthetase beta-grasp domain-containing protein, partial [Microthrixaceae bacterium]|nr:glutamine synthetase beta-grasp domain-containing protein [Microthrixaceae bacterium]HNE76340.1 glutamine synthetase beta-grasp domain-containing protein [Microthrixaceae bacterium]